ncbi:hypothetical protein ID866_12849 [Astraeus odoratus]|nr:hypothetical protein ID866_12849 [Astraeus odoratus]
MVGGVDPSSLHTYGHSQWPPREDGEYIPK